MLIYLSLLETEEEKSKFEQIYNYYRQTMFYVAKNILKDNFLSEDSVHDAFINIAKNIDKISDVTCPRTKGFVIIIVRNISINMLKKQNKIIGIDNIEENLSEDLSLEDEVLSKISFDSIVVEITNLPLIYKDVMYLAYVEDLSIQEISRLINVSNEAVKKRLQRGRRKLIEKLGKVVGHV